MPRQQQSAPPNGAKRCYSIPQAAEALNVSVRTVWQGIADGRIRSVKVSPRRRIITDAEIARILSGSAEVTTLKSKSRRGSYLDGALSSQQVRLKSDRNA